ncbi:hypothetical protein IEQ34_018702 [Dendrobium chrysotoxum]|uniref:Uncharacterized protein n=1 Tax=Dendrobium chrysotoxum TaxID=161865 RepID=A0AAV7G6J6_DENCH|nr:hypothetical protein IEQ34_018702 [Dendrobium chrysotoxum]
MLLAMIEMTENIDFILTGKNIQPFVRKIAGGGLNNVKDPQKCRPKDISNARLKSHWEIRKSMKRKLHSKALQPQHSVQSQKNLQCSRLSHQYQNA